MNKTLVPVAIVLSSIGLIAFYNEVSTPIETPTVIEQPVDKVVPQTKSVQLDVATDSVSDVQTNSIVETVTEPTTTPEVNSVTNETAIVDNKFQYKFTCTKDNQPPFTDALYYQTEQPQDTILNDEKNRFINWLEIIKQASEATTSDEIIP